MIEKDLQRFGFELEKYKLRRDIKGIQYRKVHLMNIPRFLRRWSNPNNKVEGLDMIHPNYHEVKFNMRLYWWQIKGTSWFQEIMKEYNLQKFDEE